MAELSVGIPPYLGGIIADVQAEKQGIGIALAYPDCSAAEQAAKLIVERWVTMAGEEAQGHLTARTTQGEGGLCAAAISVHIDADNPNQNPAYRSVIDARFRNQAGVLQIESN